MASVRTVTLPDGSTFTMSDWGDYQLFSRAEIAADNSQEVTLFNYVVSQEIPGGASNARATILDTNLQTASQLPLRHQMVVFSCAIVFDEADTNASGKGEISPLANGGYKQNLIAEGMRKWEAIRSNVYFTFIVEGIKPYIEGELCRYPSGGGLYFHRSEEPGTVTYGHYTVNNGEPGTHAARRLAMPVHLGALESFQGILKYPRGTIPDWTDNESGTKTAYGITVVLNGPRQRPIG